MDDQGAQGGTLYAQINHLAERSVLPPHMKEWAHELRLLGNDSAHPDGEKQPRQSDVRDILKFLDFLFQYPFILPSDIKQYRERRSRQTDTA